MELTNADYHADSAVSKSHLDMVARSPFHYKAHYIDKSIERIQTPTFLEGSLVHSMVLEPDKTNSEFCIAPKVDRRTKAGKQEYNDFMFDNAGKEIVAPDMWERAEAMRSSVYGHSEARKWLRDGVAESSHFWTDKNTGLRCKCRPDWLRDDGVIVDLKTTADASPAGFATSVASFRYHVQHAWYLDGISAEKFVFVCVEKTPPYAVAVYELDAEAYAKGQQIARYNLEQIAEGLETDIWSGYEGLNILSLPKWAK